MHPKKEKKAKKLGKLIFFSCLLFGTVLGIWKLDFLSHCINQLNFYVKGISSCASSVSLCADNALKKIAGLFNYQDSLKQKNIFKAEETARLTKGDLKNLINTCLVVNSEKRNFTLNINNQVLAVDTSLDIRLQTLCSIKASRDKGT